MKYFPENKSLIKILKKIDIDLIELYSGNLIWVSFSEAVKNNFGKISRTEKTLVNNFFNLISIINWNDKQRLSLIKKNTREDDFIAFINKTSNVFGEDLLKRKEFNEIDSNKLKGKYQDFEEKYRTELRGWELYSSENELYDYIQISFSEGPHKDLILNIV